MKRPYLKHNRLADVLALIQVLALDEWAYRTEKGLTDELQVTPASADSWRAVALEHPEFFRVSKKDEPRVSLTARHVMPKDGEHRKPLPADFTHQLFRTAIELHDRQVEAASRWRVWVPVLAAILAGIFSLGGVYLGSRLGSTRAAESQSSPARPATPTP